MTGSIILGLVAAALAVSNVYFRINARSALRRVKRALADQKKLVRFLDHSARTLVTGTDEGTWMQAMADDLAGAVQARSIRIYVVEQQHHLRVAAASGALPPSTGAGDGESVRRATLVDIGRARIDFDDGIIGRVASSGKRYFRNFEVDGQSPFSRHLDSVIVIPIAIGSRKIGVICAVNKVRKPRFFTNEDVLLLECLANQIALGGTLIQNYADLGEQNRIQQELRLAREIQKSLLPDAAPKSDWFEICGDNRPAKEVSGDLFDFVEIDDDYLMVLIADASGKGVPACMIMSMCRIFVRANAARFMDNLEGLLAELNTSLFRDTDAARFVTLACCLIDKRDYTVEYARAGHTELLIRQPTGEIQVIHPDGPALGLFPPDASLVNFDTFAFSWRPGTAIMLFTDGITEARNEANEEFGLPRLVETFGAGNGDPAHIVAEVLASVRDFSQSMPQTDDQTIVVLTRVAAETVSA